MLCERNQIKEIHIVCSRTHTAEFMSQFRIGKTTAAEGRPVLARGRGTDCKGAGGNSEGSGNVLYVDCGSVCDCTHLSKYMELYT